MPQLWEIVGGADKGGILVKDGEKLSSKALPERISTGATIEELKLVGDRLQFKRITGTGPDEGWITIALPGKVLAERIDSEGAAGESPAAESDPEAVKAQIAERCKKECAREDVPGWQGVSMEQFQENYTKELPGMRYGINFPHTPELLTSSKYGASWMTKAFHAAGTLDKNNKVKKIVRTKPLTGGGACLKALIEVEYQKPSPDLHTKLFMKFPYNYDEKTQRSDRMNSSVMLQGMEIAEVDAYRLLESSLPYPMPRYYFGDVSNQSTNFILITELVNFGDKNKKLEDYKPFEVEPAYDKFFDYFQFKPYDAFEYYSLMTASNARMAAWYKTSKFGDPAWLGKFFPDGSKGGPPGLAEPEFVRKLQMGEEFITSVAKVLFPKDLLTDKHVKEWRQTLNKVNAYKPEIYFCAGMNDDYCAIMHGNMNPDNTWFWRDEDKKLCIGALDWGGLSKVAYGPKLWWSFYAAEFEMMQDHMDDLCQIFAETHEKEGGPKLDPALLRRDLCLSALDQNVGILGAIPMIFRVISKKAWPTVVDRNDQRLMDNFLTRMYVQGFVLIYTMLFKFNLTKLVDDFIQQPGMPSKTLPNV